MSSRILLRAAIIAVCVCSVPGSLANAQSGSGSFGPCTPAELQATRAARQQEAQAIAKVRQYDVQIAALLRDAQGKGYKIPVKAPKPYVEPRHLSCDSYEERKHATNTLNDYLIRDVTLETIKNHIYVEESKARKQSATRRP